MGIDQDREHAESFIVLDEPHPAHVTGEIIHVLHALGGHFADLTARTIGDVIFGKVMHLVPFLQRLDIDGPDLGVAEGLEVLDQMAADKTTRSCDND